MVPLVTILTRVCCALEYMCLYQREGGVTLDCILDWLFVSFTSQF